MNSAIFFRKFFLYVPVKLIPAFLGVYFIFFLYSLFPQGEYVNYALAVATALITAQLSTTWIGISYLYYVTGEKDQATLFYSCLRMLLVIAPLSACGAGFISIFFTRDSAFLYVSLLCLSQILFFFLSAVFQSGFSVSSQLIAVIIQALCQVSFAFLTFEYVVANYKMAIAALSIGYFAASFFLLVIKLKEYGLAKLAIDKNLFKKNLQNIFGYGAALSPWMLGVLIMTAADRFAIGYYNVPGGDAYLSLKDLMVGAGGLLSMPLLMMVHSIVINRFKEGYFAKDIVKSSFSFLIISFSAFWVFLENIGLDLFVLITDKQLGIAHIEIFVAFFSVFLSSVSIYIQKRLEVHRRIGRLAFLSLGCAVVSVAFGFGAGAVGGILEISFAVTAAQTLYFILLMRSTFRIADFTMFLRPSIWSLFLFGAGKLLGFVFFDNASTAGYWIFSFTWVTVFLFLVLLALWKGVSWSVFTQGQACK